MRMRNIQVYEYVLKRILFRTKCEIDNSTTATAEKLKPHLNMTAKWCSGPLKFLDPPGPLTALASSPGSGNTWTRYLIQQFSGYVTGAIYTDTVLRQNDFPGENFYDGRVIVIKTHETT